MHINLGYVYAEGGGQGLYPGAMHKAAGMRVSLCVRACVWERGGEEVAETGERGSEREEGARGREGGRERGREGERERARERDMWTCTYHLRNQRKTHVCGWAGAAAFEGATKLVPDMVDAYTYWGNALQEMGLMEDASKVINRAISKFVKGKSKGGLKAPLH